MGKSTNSMAIFQSHVKLPEGNPLYEPYLKHSHIVAWPRPDERIGPVRHWHNGLQVVELCYLANPPKHPIDPANHQLTAAVLNAGNFREWSQSSPAIPFPTHPIQQPYVKRTHAPVKAPLLANNEPPWPPTFFTTWITMTSWDPGLLCPFQKDHEASLRQLQQTTVFVGPKGPKNRWSCGVRVSWNRDGRKPNTHV